MSANLIAIVKANVVQLGVCGIRNVGLGGDGCGCGCRCGCGCGCRRGCGCGLSRTHTQGTASVWRHAPRSLLHHLCACISSCKIPSLNVTIHHRRLNRWWLCRCCAQDTAALLNERQRDTAAPSRRSIRCRAAVAPRGPDPQHTLTCTRHVVHACAYTSSCTPLERIARTKTHPIGMNSTIVAGKKPAQMSCHGLSA